MSELSRVGMFYSFSSLELSLFSRKILEQEGFVRESFSPLIPGIIPKIQDQIPFPDGDSKFPLS